MKILFEFNPQEFKKAVVNGSLQTLIDDIASEEEEIKTTVKVINNTINTSISEPKTEPEPKSEPGPESNTEEENIEAQTFTLEQVRAELAEISRSDKTKEVKKLITSFGVDKLTDIPAEKYPEVMKKAEELK